VPKLKAQAMHLFAQGLTVEAIRALEQAVRFQPTGDAAFEAWLMLGRLRMVNPAWSTRAIDALMNASRIRPRATDPWISMGEIYQRKGFPGEAATCYRKARTLDASVEVPADVDLQAVHTAQARAAATPKGILDTFRTLLSGKPKS
jgi:cytochrome c-type biogenesis protein CcmH/NrfG